jgi:hypothetical protein
MPGDAAWHFLCASWDDGRPTAAMILEEKLAIGMLFLHQEKNFQDHSPSGA